MTTALHARLRRVPFDRMPGFSALYTTYCADYDRLAAFYSGDWRSPEALRQAADRAASHPRNRDRLADVLLEQNERWGFDPATWQHIDALRASETVAVVTGQQVGLFTGPLYTPYKTLTTLQLVRRLAEETGRPVVPIFWLEGSDHDFEEVAHVNLLRQNAVAPLRYSGHTLPENGNLGPVGRLKLNEQITHVIDQVAEILPPTDFRDAMLTHLRAAYQPGRTLLDAFARFMRALFPETGLVFMDPDDVHLKQMAAPLFRREIEDCATSSARLKAVSDVLARDFHAQVHTRPTNLFLCDGEGRHPIDAEEGHFRLRGQDRTFSRNQLLILLDNDPRCFSPNVALRPLMQDGLLPTAAYVAGPGEVAYFAQFKPLYEWAEVPMPVIYPRASLTLTETKVKKVLDTYAVDVADVGEDLDRLFQRVVLQAMDVDIEAVFKEAGGHLHQAINGLKPNIEQVDRTLVRTAEATRASLLKELEKLKGRVVRAEKQNHDQVRAGLEKAQVNLYPGGKLQERSLSVLYFVNKYGPDFLTGLIEQLSLDTSEHQVVEL
jgi:bacillithiol biosynthesis cysteine-adding enzyme BshC